MGKYGSRPPFLVPLLAGPSYKLQVTGEVGRRGARGGKQPILRQAQDRLSQQPTGEGRGRGSASFASFDFVFFLLETKVLRWVGAR